MRIVIFTTGSPTPEWAALLNRLAADDQLQIAGVIVDLYKPSAFQRLNLLLSKWGFADWGLSLLLVAGQTLLRLPASLLQHWHDWNIKPLTTPSYETLCAAHGIPLVETADIHSDQTVSEIQSLNADLGVIMGGRILKDKVTTLPRLGTLNIHGHDVHKYRGEAQIGYPERLNGDAHLGVAIHKAVEKADSGAVLLEQKIKIEKYDNDLSLQIKMAAAGVELYHRAIKGYLNGDLKAVSQDLTRGETYYSTPHWRRLRLWRPIHKALWRDLNRKHSASSNPIAHGAYSLVREALFWLALPWFAARRRAFERAGRAPVMIFYYHGVGNGAENWMTLPVEVLMSHVHYAAKYYDVISLSEAVKRLKSGRNPKTAVVFTFDDGYRSCFDNLLPLCRVHNLPATLFVCAESTRQDLRLQHDVSKGYLEAPLLNPEEVKACARDGLEIGSHAMKHEIMSKLSDDEASRVFVESRKILEDMTGGAVRFFSFPKGGTADISAANLTEGRKHYEGLFSAYGGYNFPSSPDAFYFQRFANPSNLRNFRVILAGAHRFKPFYRAHAPN